MVLKCPWDSREGVTTFFFIDNGCFLSFSLRIFQFQTSLSWKKCLCHTDMKPMHYSKICITRFSMSKDSQQQFRLIKNTIAKTASIWRSNFKKLHLPAHVGLQQWIARAVTQVFISQVLNALSCSHSEAALKPVNMLHTHTRTYMHHRPNKS